MKKYILASILILTTYVGFAQPYFPVERGVTTYYMSFGGGYNSQIIDSNMNTYFFNPQLLIVLIIVKLLCYIVFGERK
jgi:hypothetical protein